MGSVRVCAAIKRFLEAAGTETPTDLTGLWIGPSAASGFWLFPLHPEIDTRRVKKLLGLRQPCSNWKGSRLEGELSSLSFVRLLSARASLREDGPVVGLLVDSSQMTLQTGPSPAAAGGALPEGAAAQLHTFYFLKLDGDPVWLVRSPGVSQPRPVGLS